ncbi:MAG: hypothetical protein MI919_32625, partial [Holophagales bacterium]|nr:hypothetical protein [Holophagales bacterium]
MIHLTPDILANVLVRQKIISVDQANEVKKEARRIPRHQRSPKACQQRSLAYELVTSLGLTTDQHVGAPIDEQVIADAIAR